MATEEIIAKAPILNTEKSLEDKIYRGTQTPVTIPCSFEELKKEVEVFLPNTSIALHIMLAVATSGVRRNPVMLWVLFVGAPSSGKTELLKLIKKNKNVLSLDTLTQNSFISGERITKDNKVHDLLEQLNNTCLVVKDWTAVFSTDERQTKKIVGDLVGIYDKSFEKFSSARGKVSYNAEFSHLGAITPATLNKHHNYLNMIGPRFLFYSIPSLSKNEEDKSFDAIFAKTDRKIQEQRVSKLVNDYLTYLNTKTSTPIDTLSNEVQEYFKVAARFLARGRGIVIMQQSSFKGEDGNEITYYEPLEVQIEQPFRAIQQLITLAEYLAFVANKGEVGEEELAIIKEIVIGSMPADRSQALRAIQESENGEITAKKLSEDVDKSAKTARRLLEELCNLGLVEKVKGSGVIASTYRLVDEYKSFILGTPREFMSHKEILPVVDIEVPEERYGLTPPPPSVGVTAVTEDTIEAKNGCDPIEGVTLISETEGNKEMTPFPFEEFPQETQEWLDQRLEETKKERNLSEGAKEIDFGTNFQDWKKKNGY